MDRRDAALSLCIIVFLAGCPETNTPPIDANRADTSSALDAPLTIDSSTLDVSRVDASCPDVDFDGETDAACGGTDCDDTDPTLSSALGPCGTPTAMRRCVGGVIRDIECADDTPYCDARVGECVANACGDGVRHANEFCETGDLRCAACLEGCGDSHACPEGQTCRATPAFSGSPARGCIPANLTGDPDGTLCVLDDQCYSRYCDPTQRRCTSVLDRARCNRAGSRVDHDLYARWRPDYESPPLCKYSCFHQSECGDGASCVLARTIGPGVYMMATCLRPPVGTAELGAPCALDTDCASAVCAARRCTLVCRDDSDCGPALPSCVPVDLSEEWAYVTARPDDWPTPWPLLCAP